MTAMITGLAFLPSRIRCCSSKLGWDGCGGLAGWVLTAFLFAVVPHHADISFHSCFNINSPPPRLFLFPLLWNEPPLRRGKRDIVIAWSRAKQ